MKRGAATALLTLQPFGLDDDDIVMAALRQELISLPGVKKVDPTPAEDQKTDDFLSSKSGTALGIAGLTVTIAPFALKQAVALLKVWVERQKARTVIVELEGDRIEVKASSPREQRQAMELFLQRNTRAPEVTGSDE